MKVDEMFPKRYASGADLNGKAVVVVLDKVQSEQMRTTGTAPELKFVLYVAGGKRGIVLSRTLAYQIAEAVDEPDVDKWPGKRITLYPEPMNVAGKPRIAIRARAAANGNGHAAEGAAR
jgi:hypothetical protein